MMAALSRQPVGGVVTMPRRHLAVGDPMVAIVSAMTAAVAMAVVIGALVVFVRRVSGGFTAGPSPSMTWGVAATGVALIAAIDTAIHAGMIGQWTGILARLGAFLAVAAMIPSGPPVGSVIAGMVALGLVSTAALLPLRGIGWPADSTSHDEIPLRRMRLAAPPTPGLAERERGQEATLGMPPGLRQRLERFQSSDGVDHVVGRILIDVATGSRTGHGHLGFCPPFVAMPAVDVTSEDDSVEVVVSAAEVVPWGVRVECRLSEPAEEPLAIPVHVIARYPS